LKLLEYPKKIGLIYTFLLVIYIVNPYNLGLLIGYLIPPIVWLHKDLIVKSLNPTLIFLFLFSLFYAIFFSYDPVSGKQYIVLYAIVPPAFYLLGKLITIRLDHSSTRIYYILIAIAILLSSTSMLSVIKGIQELGFASVDRNLPNFWSGAIVSATLMGAYFSLNMCIPAIIMAKQKKSAILKIILAITYLITLVCVLKIGSRTQLGITVLTLMITLLYLFPKQSLQRNLAMIFVFIGLVAYASTKLDLSLDGELLSAFAGRSEGGVEELASGGGRTDKWVKSLINIYKRPLGWDVEDFGHSHNLWLDALRVGGVLSFFPLVFFTARALAIIKKAIKKNKKAVGLNVVMLTTFVAFFMVFMVEPILEGLFIYFSVFCLIVGIADEYGTSKPIID
jgi:O-antigen ligase